MLTETEFHYVCGLLYLRTCRKRSDVRVEAAILGAKVFDESVGKSRDIDIVVATAENIALIGVEVKDERRPLDVTTVEQISQKFHDMPSIGERYLVSASGYTGPARKKAAHHGLGCLSLIRCSPSAIGGIDLSELDAVTHSVRSWGPPNPLVAFNLGDIVGVDPMSIPDESLVILQDGTTITMGELAKRTAQAALGSLPLNESTEPTRHRVEVLYSDNPVLALSHSRAKIRSATVEGIVTVASRHIPLYDHVCLLDENDTVFGATVLCDLGDSLLGLQLTLDRELSIIHIPEQLRKKKPVRYPIV